MPEWRGGKKKQGPPDSFLTLCGIDIPCVCPPPPHFIHHILLPKTGVTSEGPAYPSVPLKCCLINGHKASADKLTKRQGPKKQGEPVPFPSDPPPSLNCSYWQSTPWKGYERPSQSILSFKAQHVSFSFFFTPLLHHSPGRMKKE